MRMPHDARRGARIVDLELARPGSDAVAEDAVEQGFQTRPLPSTDVVMSTTVRSAAWVRAGLRGRPSRRTPATARPAAGWPAGNSRTMFSMRFPCVRRCDRASALKPVQKERGGEQVGGAAGRHVQLEQHGVERLQQHAGRRASRRRLRPARAAAPCCTRRQCAASAARQHAGVVELADHGEQRVQARGRLAVAALARAPRVPAGPSPRHAESRPAPGRARRPRCNRTACLLALVAGERGRVAIGHARDRAGACGDASGVAGPPVRARPPSRSRPSAQIAPRCVLTPPVASQHRGFAVAADPRRCARAASQRSVPRRDACARHRAKAGCSAQRRCAHQRPVEVVMRAAAADVDEPGFGESVASSISAATAMLRQTLGEVRRACGCAARAVDCDRSSRITSS